MEIQKHPVIRYRSRRSFYFTWE